MTTAETNRRPFWTEEKPWQESKLPTISGAAKAEEIVSAVPTFTTVETPVLLVNHTRKDGLLLYHFFLRQRKEIFDAAEAEMNLLRDTVRNLEQVRAQQQEVAAKANQELAAIPWPSSFEGLLKTVFEKHFKYHPFKANFYPETDSWSVAMPEPSSPLTFTAERLAAPVLELSSVYETAVSAG